MPPSPTNKTATYAVAVAASCLAASVAWFGFGQESNAIVVDKEAKPGRRASPTGVVDAPVGEVKTAALATRSAHSGAAGTAASNPARQRDFGRVIDDAIASGNPRDSLRAARLLAQCQDIEDHVDGLFRFLQTENLNDAKKKILLDLLSREQSKQRNCQSISESQYLLKDRLLEVAAKGGEYDAAGMYYMQMRLAGQEPTEKSG